MQQKTTKKNRMLSISRFDVWMSKHNDGMKKAKKYEGLKYSKPYCLSLKTSYWRTICVCFQTQAGVDDIKFAIFFFSKCQYSTIWRRMCQKLLKKWFRCCSCSRFFFREQLSVIKANIKCLSLFMFIMLLHRNSNGIRVNKKNSFMFCSGFSHRIFWLKFTFTKFWLKINGKNTIPTQSLWYLPLEFFE